MLQICYAIALHYTVFFYMFFFFFYACSAVEVLIDNLLHDTLFHERYAYVKIKVNCDFDTELFALWHTHLTAARLARHVP
jgi:hypothetical protein